MVAQQAYDLFIDCIRGGHVCATATFELLGSVKCSCFLSPVSYTHLTLPTNREV